MAGLVQPKGPDVSKLADEERSVRQIQDLSFVIFYISYKKSPDWLTLSILGISEFTPCKVNERCESIHIVRDK